MSGNEPSRRIEGVLARGPEVVIVGRINSYAEYSPATAEFIQSILARANAERSRD